MKNAYTREDVSSIENLAYEYGVAVGWLQERNRIIVLIEAQPRVANDGLVNANHLIALINGEVDA